MSLAPSPRPPPLLYCSVGIWGHGACWPQWQVLLLGNPSTLHRTFQQQLLLSVWKLKPQVEPPLRQFPAWGIFLALSSFAQQRWHYTQGLPGPSQPRWPAPASLLSSLSSLWLFVCGWHIFPVGRTEPLCHKLPNPNPFSALKDPLQTFEPRPRNPINILPWTFFLRHN